MRKEPIRGKSFWGAEKPSLQRTLAILVETLTEKLPSGWSIVLEPLRDDIDSGARFPAPPDARLIIRAPDGPHATLVVEAKRHLDPKLVPLVVDQLARYMQGARGVAGMVVAPFLSPRARDLLAEAGLAYADSTGNMRVVLDRPALYVETAGASSDPWTRYGDRPLRSLKGPTAGRVVRALCDFRPPFGVEQLARRSGTSLGSVSRVFAFLDPEGLITREPRGPVTDVKWADLIRRWAQDYSFTKTNTSRTFLEARGLPALLGKLKSASFRYAVTGSLAAVQVAPIAPPRLATVYVDDIDQRAKELSLRPAEAGANVILAEPFDRVVFERTWEREGVTYAALSQAAVDLLTGPGRGPAEGEELLQWMQDPEHDWRS